jgi:hypothetical protein
MPYHIVKLLSSSNEKQQRKNQIIGADGSVIFIVYAENGSPLHSTVLCAPGWIA